MDRFETDRLIIRRFVREDWPDIQKLAIDKEPSQAAAWDRRWPTDEEGCKRATDFLARNNYWAVCLKDGGRVIGFVSYNSNGCDARRRAAAMIELPEAASVARQLAKALKGRRVGSADAGNSPHKWVWYKPSREARAAELPGRAVYGKHGRDFGDRCLIPSTVGRLIELRGASCHTGRLRHSTRARGARAT